MYYALINLCNIVYINNVSTLHTNQKTGKQPSIKILKYNAVVRDQLFEIYIEWLL